MDSSFMMQYLECRKSLTQKINIMKKGTLLYMLGFSGLLLSTSCTPEPESSTLTLNINGLEDLGSDYVYEGWLMVDGSPITAGIFTVDANGMLSENMFEIDADDLANASAYVLTIEPSSDPDPAPSDVHILAGDFSGNSASISVDHGAALGNDFTDAMGTYILATPTDGGSMDNELAGVWWLDPSSGTPAVGLDLPTLPAGWAYEGWAVIDGNPVSTGQFTDPAMADDFSGYSSSAAMAPPFPGEDFLENAPAGLMFPADLSGATVVISVEPSPDNSPAPFTLKPLVSMIGDMPAHHTPYTMENNAAMTNPMGSVSR